MNPVHFSSATDLWSTPQDFFDRLNEEFGFTLDVCATAENAKCEAYFSPEADGLSFGWDMTQPDGSSVPGVAWMNPPYGRTIGKWVAKAAEEAKKGATVVALLPARTDTRWFWDYCYQQPNTEIRFVKGRLKFGDAKHAAPFPSMVVVFYPPLIRHQNVSLADANELLMKVFTR